MSISEFYPDSEIISELRMFFDEDIEFEQCLSQIESVDDNTFQIKIKGRVFQFDKVFCGVEEIE